MNLDELKTFAQTCAETLRNQQGELNAAADEVKTEGQKVVAALGRHRAAAPTGAAITSSVAALSKAGTHCQKAAVDIAEWIGSNY
jgi:malate/lactate dehydrogenase